MRALIVEDTYINQEFLKMALEGVAKCQVVESGEDAVSCFSEALKSAPLDVIFMDVMLPGIDGLEAIGQIRALESESAVAGSGVKIVVMTALEDDDRISSDDIQGEGIVFMPKPVTEDGVASTLRSLELID